ncbi:MAG TPA: UDP-N-acetylmuramoyl-L-alanine--D-glutamate ligase [Steroidobacteraceae bacterium]|jgi:UDP-N-acetylmuramoylalanine--D-glutamate ligase
MTLQAHNRPATLPQQGRTIVVGLGRTGLSCARYLQSRGISFAVTDSRAAPPESAALQQLAPDADTAFGGFDERLLEGASEIVVSPGVSLREPFMVSAAARGISIVGDIELFARDARAPIAAVTGTNGKSTVTTLVARMAEASGLSVLAGGNLGRPALDLLQEPVPQLYVLELSSFQLDTTQSLHCAAATVLNVTPDHMDRYVTLHEYAASKARIFNRCDAAILNMDDVAVRTMPIQSPRVLGFSLVKDPTAQFYATEHHGAKRVVNGNNHDVALMHLDERVALMSELKIAGLHNAANALASLAMADALKLPQAACVQALREFPGLPHRSQWVADVAGVLYVDDSKGTNVGATLAAVAGMPGSLVLIAGGQGKGQDFAPLADAFRGKVRHVVLLGQDAQQIADVLRGICTMEFARDMHEAVRMSARAAQSGETVLLSPACASLDMFRDYAQRGDVFATAVRGLNA